jgi:hypothetical protein
MKTTNKPAFLFTAILMVGLLSMAGCATNGLQRSTKAGNSMQVVEDDIRQVVAQVDVTGKSLRDLVKPGQSDVKKSFKKYSANVDKMEKLEQRYFEHADKMNAQGKDYFQEWQTQGDTYASPQIQALSEQRRADQSAVFVKISEANVGVRGAFKAYMSDIREIEMYLSNDLTSKGVESITPITQKAVMDGAALKDAINPVLFAIGQARAELAQGGN